MAGFRGVDNRRFFTSFGGFSAGLATCLLSSLGGKADVRCKTCACGLSVSSSPLSDGYSFRQYTLMARSLRNSAFIGEVRLSTQNDK